MPLPAARGRRSSFCTAFRNPGTCGVIKMDYTSAGNNNGSAFAGLSANTVFYNTALGLVILFGRFMMLVAVLALAGSLAAKNTVPPSAGRCRRTRRCSSARWSRRW